MQRKKYCGKLNNVLDDILLLQQTIWVNELVNKWVQLFANCFVFSNFCSTHDLSNEAQRSPAETYTLYHDFVNSVFAIFKIYLTIFGQIGHIHFLSIYLPFLNSFVHFWPYFGPFFKQFYESKIVLMQKWPENGKRKPIKICKFFLGEAWIRKSMIKFSRQYFIAGSDAQKKQSKSRKSV